MQNISWLYVMIKKESDLIKKVNNNLQLNIKIY